MKCHCCRPLALTMSHTDKNPGRLFFKCFSRQCPFFQWADQDPWGKNRLWLETEKISYLHDGRIARRTFEDVMGVGPFEGNWPPEVTPKEQMVLERRGLAPPNQSEMHM